MCECVSMRDCVCKCVCVFSLIPKQLKKKRFSLSLDQLEILLLSVLTNTKAAFGLGEE